MNALADLQKLVPPPERPLEVPSTVDWERCSRELAALPEDYQVLITNYGTGAIDTFLWIFNPAAANENLNLVTQARLILDDLAETANDFPDEFDMRRFPEPGGLLPFGGTDNGDTLFWVTEGPPETWTVAVMGAREPDVFHYSGNATSFLVGLLNGEIRCPLLPENFPSGLPVSFQTAT